MTRRLLAAASAIAVFAGVAQAETVLHILHRNDVHTRIEPINACDNTCDAETRAAGECFGGVARIAAKIAELRDRIIAEGGRVIVLEAGDQYQGTLFYTTYKGKDVVEFMTDIGYDAMAVGKSEFDDGPEGLAAAVPGIDAVIGGHSHTLLGDMEGAQGASPPWSTSRTARRCPSHRPMPMASIWNI